MKRMFEKLYKYNRWRYEELFTSIEKQENFLIFLTKDSGLFFNSVLGTLKHLLAADYIWYGRIKQINEISIPLLEEKKIMSLNLKELILLWQSNDNKIFEQLQLDYFQTKQLLLEINLVYQQLIESVNEEWFEQEFQYLDSRGIKLQKDPQTALYHLINHHTHHLGQISTVYTQMYDRKDFFSTDFIYFK